MKAQKLYTVILLLAFISLGSMSAYAQNTAKSFDVEYTIQLNEFNKGAKELFVNTYFKEVMDGKREAYRWLETNKRVSADEISELAILIDTFYVENPEPPYDLQMRVSHLEGKPVDLINNISVKEKWTVDESGDIKKKVLSLAPAIGNRYLCVIKL